MRSNLRLGRFCGARVWSIAAIMALAPMAAGAAPGQDDGAGAYATRQYRNLFAEAGHSREESPLYLMALLHCSGEFRIW